MNVYTYFHPLPSMDAGKEHELIVLWQRSWRRCGFEPTVLTHLHAEAHPRFKEYDQLVRGLPSVNPPGYDLACWHRWLALAVVGGGLMTDYDVIANAIDEMALFALPDPITCLDRGGVPCAIFCHLAEECFPGKTFGELTREQNPAQDIVLGVFDTPHQIVQINGQRHTSDMYYHQSRNWPKAAALTAPCGAEGWRQAPAVHFSHADTARTFPGHDRARVIRREMQLPAGGK